MMTRKKNKLVERKALVDTGGLRVPIWKINFCSGVLRLSELRTTVCCVGRTFPAFYNTVELLDVGRGDTLSHLTLRHNLLPVFIY